LRVLYFGTYERDYPRNTQVISCLRRAGVEVDERHEPVWERRANWSAGAGSAVRLLGAQLKLLRRPPRRYDAVVVGYPGHLDLIAARRAARAAPVVFNALVSLHNSFVEDRRRFEPGSAAARALLALDRHAFRAADMLVADTRAHADYFADLAGLPRDRVHACYIGAEERLFKPGWRPEAPALFVGKLIPLHGLETILAAARTAPDIPLRIAGSGQLTPLLETRPPNVEWIPWLERDQVAEEVGRAAVALGVFGTTAKAGRVIPNKVFEALACGTPVITADTPAARELLVDGESALLVPPGDATALADALRRLLADEALARRLSAGGRRVYEEQASEEVLGRRWRSLLEAAAG
jgi:glycosyltransferase involved in cell wall biosynthesis